MPDSDPVSPPNTIATTPEKARVWDLYVRVNHWLLLITVAGAWATRKIPGDWFAIHTWLGYATLVLVVTRIVWGIVGTRHARFANFVRGPSAVWRYLRELLGGAAGRTVGHNPLGALMVLALLAALLVQALTGLFANNEISEFGPLMGYVGNDTSLALTSWHRRLADVIPWLLAIHVAAALFHWWVKRDNLIVPLWTGDKPAAHVPATERIASSRFGWALAIALLAAATLAWFVRRAPVAEVYFF